RHVLEAKASEIAMERRSCRVVRGVEVDAAVAVEVGQGDVVARDGSTKTGVGGDLHERRVRRTAAKRRRQRRAADPCPSTRHPPPRARPTPAAPPPGRAAWRGGGGSGNRRWTRVVESSRDAA